MMSQIPLNELRNYLYFLVRYIYLYFLVRYIYIYIFSDVREKIQLLGSFNKAISWLVLHLVTNSDFSFVSKDHLLQNILFLANYEKKLFDHIRAEIAEKTKNFETGKENCLKLILWLQKIHSDRQCLERDQIKMTIKTLKIFKIFAKPKKFYWGNKRTISRMVWKISF